MRKMLKPYELVIIALRTDPQINVIKFNADILQKILKAFLKRIPFRFMA